MRRGRDCATRSGQYMLNIEPPRSMSLWAHASRWSNLEKSMGDRSISVPNPTGTSAGRKSATFHNRFGMEATRAGITRSVRWIFKVAHYIFFHEFDEPGYRR